MAMSFVELIYAVPNDGSYNLLNQDELQNRIALFHRGKASEWPEQPGPVALMLVC